MLSGSIDDARYRFDPESIAYRNCPDPVGFAGYKHSSRLRSVVSLLLALAVLSGAEIPARAASPADELLRFVPADAAFCFIARDLRDHARDLAESPFVAAMRKTPAGDAIARSDELVKLNKFQDELQQHLKIDWDTLRNDVFGEAVAFAYWPGPPGKPEQEAGLILIRARVAKTLEDLVSRVNELQKQSGELKEIEKRSHKGITYFVRFERDKPTYYYLHGPVLALSAQESLLTRVLEAEQAMAADAEAPLARELRQMGVGQAAAALLINPRAFDAHVREHCQADTPQAPAIRVFERYWKALEGIALALQLNRDAAVSLTVRCRTADLPDAARRFLAEAARTSDLWQAFPDRVIIAAAKRIDLAALVDVVGEFLPKTGKPNVTVELNRALGPPLGKDFVKEVLPCIGPDIGFCLYAPPAADKDWSPQGFVALKVGTGDPSAPVDRALLAGLNTLAMLAVVAHNTKDADHPLALKSASQDKREIKYLSGEGVFPPGLEPSFGLHSGYLVAATSPAAFKRFAPAPRPPAVDGVVPILRVDLRELREYLKTRSQSLATVLADKDGMKPADVRFRLENFVGTLELFDRLEMYQVVSPGQVALTLRLQPAQPFKK
jgi:hypothetical protein